MKFLPEEEDNLGFQLAPMIDVVFMLLTFFIVAGSYTQTETELRIKLPNLEHGKPSPAILQIFIGAEGSIVVNEVPYDELNSRELPQLRNKLQLLLDTDRNFPVLIIPEAETPHQRVMDVLNACHGTGVVNVSFSGNAGGEPPPPPKGGGG